MTREIPLDHLPVISDRFRTFDDPRMSRDIMVELVHGYEHFLHMRRWLEQQATGNSTQVDYAKVAARLLEDERSSRRRLNVSRRLLTIDMC